MSGQHPKDSQYLYLRSFGRRKARRLTQQKNELVETLLPKICISLAELDTKLEVLQSRYKKIWLEIGFGKGEHLSAMAADHPDIGFIGCEPFLNGIAGLLDDIDSQKLSNISIYDEDVRELLQEIKQPVFERVYIPFPDPWPKVKHFKRRLINRQLLDWLHNSIVPEGKLIIATDDPSYLEWILRHVMDHSGFEWIAQSKDDWQVFPEDWHITRYQEKAQRAGRQCSYLEFSKIV